MVAKVGMCYLCKRIREAKRPYRDQDSEAFVVVFCPKVRGPAVILREHALMPEPALVVDALRALRITASRVFGSGYYIVTEASPHWWAAAKRLRRKPAEVVAAPNMQPD